MGRDEGGKTDMERVGLFSEVGYTTIGDKYPKVGNGMTFCPPFPHIGYSFLG